jgi:hypothetical protein
VELRMKQRAGLGAAVGRGEVDDGELQVRHGVRPLR